MNISSVPAQDAGRRVESKGGGRGGARRGRRGRERVKRVSAGRERGVKEARRASPSAGRRAKN